VEDAPALESPLGRITIANEVVAQIVGRTAAECYGVVGTASRVKLPRLLTRERLTHGVAVRREGAGVAVELNVVVEHGLNLAEVATSVRNRVAYEVERLTGLAVASVDVRIEDVRQSA
jgi:uncharacterized alkaline shock family protein YloU